MVTNKEQIEKLIAAYNAGTPLVSDEEYDNILEEYLKENGGESARPFLRQKQSSYVNDIVGTLPKVYGVETPMRDGQKTYAEWVAKTYSSDKAVVAVQPKFDGCSVALDCHSRRFFTRGDTDNGESVDVTDLFVNATIKLPDDTSLEDFDSIKFEAIIAREIYMTIGMNLKYKRPRDACQAIIHSRDSELSHHITLIPLRYYSDGKQHVYTQHMGVWGFCDPHHFQQIREIRQHILSHGGCVCIDGLTYDCDGVVISEVSETDIVNPEHEVALKILNMVAETKLKRVEFQLGKTGRVTPVAILEPVKFGNVTVDHVTLSTMQRIRDMNLHEGDVVRIMYNIVPYLLSSNGGGKVPVTLPAICPQCGSSFDMTNLQLIRCSNPDCDGVKLGALIRYAEKMKMFGISDKTIERLWDEGLLRKLQDFYNLDPEYIAKLNGFGYDSAHAIVTSVVNASRNVPLTRFLGALPILDVSERTWISVNQSDIDGAIRDNSYESFERFIVSKLKYSVKSKTILSTFKNRWDEFRRLYITVDPEISRGNDNIKSIALSGTRDKDLIKHLEDVGYTVNVNGFTKHDSFLVIPDVEYTSSKVKKAHEWGTQVITMEEAFKLTSGGGV